jgi:hypothetical protein
MALPVASYLLMLHTVQTDFFHIPVMPHSVFRELATFTEKDIYGHEDYGNREQDYRKQQHLKHVEEIIS